MKKLVCMVLILFFVGIYADNMKSPVGYWKTVDDNSGEERSIVQIWEENGVLKGKILKLFPGHGKGPNPVCEKCKGAKKNQPVEGLEIMWGLKKDDDEWNGGKILDPENGKEYKCLIELEKSGRELTVRGYIGISLFGRSQTWIRTTAPKK